MNTAVTSVPSRSVASALTLVALLALFAVGAGCQRLKIGNPSINLLNDSIPARDTINGRWALADSRLESDASQYAIIALPAIPHGDYELSTKFARLVGQGSVNFILAVGERQVMLVIGARDQVGTYSGLEDIDLHNAGSNITTDRQFQIINNRLYDLDATVRTRGQETRIDVNIDDRPFVRWTGQTVDLSVPTEWQLPGAARIALGAHESVVQFRSVRMRTIPADISWLD